MSQQELTKHIYDLMQEFHSKTLLYTISMSVGCDRASKRFEDLVDVVDRCDLDGTPLHLKIKAYHAEVARGDRQNTQLKQSEIVDLMIQRH